MKAPPQGRSRFRVWVPILVLIPVTVTVTKKSGYYNLKQKRQKYQKKHGNRNTMSQNRDCTPKIISGQSVTKKTGYYKLKQKIQQYKKKHGIGNTISWASSHGSGSWSRNCDCIPKSFSEGITLLLLLSFKCDSFGSPHWSHTRH